MKCMKILMEHELKWLICLFLASTFFAANNSLKILLIRAQKQSIKYDTRVCFWHAVQKVEKSRSFSTDRSKLTASADQNGQKNADSCKKPPEFTFSYQIRSAIFRKQSRCLLKRRDAMSKWKMFNQVKKLGN